MIIDFHTHITDFRNRPDEQDRDPVTFESLIARLDEEGIDKAVLLPIYASPDAVTPYFIIGEGFSMRDQVLNAKRYADRIIAFGNLDPRWLHNSPDTDFGPLLRWFKEQGCQGIGEVTSNIPFDDPRTINMFQQIGDFGWCVVLHATGFGPGVYGLQDDPGAPRLERLLQAAPQTNIVCHGPGFWCEIAANVSLEDKMGYPNGPVPQEGALWRLMRKYPNLYCDMSAGSGFNGLTRDSEAGIRFLNEFTDRIVFATDVCVEGPKHRMPHKPYLEKLLSEGKLSQTAFEKIMGGNGEKLLGWKR